MRAVIQRVKNADVKVDGKTTGEIGEGLLILLGVGPEDTEENADTLIKKICNLRKKLDDSISNKEDYAKIYKMSVQLDNLINEYYREVERRKQNNDSKNAY